MKILGYKQYHGDHTLFYQHSTSGKVSILIVYVDDIIITGTDTEANTTLEKHLAQYFEIKRLGPLRYFLGMEVARSGTGLIMTQQKYILDLLEETKLVNSHINGKPNEANHKLTINKDDPRIEPGSNKKLISKLLYLAHTHPDISDSISVLSQFMHSPH